jgi:outer membrane protein OmpA-like peptidoglycan-associated protein
MSCARLLALAFVLAVPAGGAGAGWQTPGDIQVPKGTWQVPGDIQVPKGIEAVKEQDAGKCVRRITVVGDALFDFDKSTLRNDAEVTLAAAGPEIAKAGGHKIAVIGHTDAIGSDAYNDRLSEARARTVRDWLAGHAFVPADTGVKGMGKRQPIAANTKPDGSDDPAGRQKNRRVEVDIDTCG